MLVKLGTVYEIATGSVKIMVADNVTELSFESVWNDPYRICYHPEKSYILTI